MNFDQLKKIIKESIENSSNRNELWAYFLKQVDPHNACEVGVWKGDFARYLLDHVESIEKYFLVDPWRNLPNWNKPANLSDDDFETVRREALEKKLNARIQNF